MLNLLLDPLTCSCIPAPINYGHYSKQHLRLKDPLFKQFVSR